MASDIQPSPFLKELASSDRSIRDKSIDSLRAYLVSNRTFTDLELLKLWKGIFFCMWHSDRSRAQQRLALSLSHLLLPLPAPLFLQFLNAFWSTISAQYHLIDSLRLDKFLLLTRYYINAAFMYISYRDWDSTLLESYLEIVRGILLEDQGKVPDGLRYHVLDVWVDELVRVSDDAMDVPVEEVMDAITRVQKEGRTKVLKEMAREVGEDDRLSNLGQARGDEDGQDESNKDIENEDKTDEEWEGLGD